MENRIFDSHPAPGWARRNWTPLDGEWRLRTRGKTRTVVVPFPVGSPASKVPYRDGGTFSYSRDFAYEPKSGDSSLILRVGAADYRTTVRVNGETVGGHVGGYASFAFDISDHVRAGTNRLELVVRDSRSMRQVRGKQTFLPFPFAVWYRGTTGIWQSVWIEETGPRFLRRAELDYDFERGEFVLEAETAPARGIAPKKETAAARVSVSAVLSAPDGNERRLEAEAAAPGDAPGGERFSARFRAEEPSPWSPEKPTLYAVRYELIVGGRTVDAIESYAGFRTVGWGKAGLEINGKPTTFRAALFQGYYPEGGYAPLSREAVERDLDDAIALGFNGLRVHQKVESPYFQYLCDRKGLLCSFEMPSFYLPSRRAFAAYEAELRELIERDRRRPSCVMRMLFNETWGVWGMYGEKSRTRAFVLAMVRLTRELDPTRPVVDNSGWEHLDSDIVDIHHYLGSAERARDFYGKIAAGDRETLFGLSVPKIVLFYLRNTIDKETRALYLTEGAKRDDKPLFLSEYGGFGWYKTEGAEPTEDHIERYTRDCAESGLFAGYCLTQLHDVEGETNGLFDAERRPKVSPDRMRRINAIPLGAARGQDKLKYRETAPSAARSAGG